MEKRVKGPTPFEHLSGAIEHCRIFCEGVLYEGEGADETFGRQRSIFEEGINDLRYTKGSVGGSVLRDEFRRVFDGFPR